jgi:hypothetical protein
MSRVTAGLVLERTTFLFFLIHGACSYVIDLLTGAIWDHNESIDLKMIKKEKNSDCTYQNGLFRRELSTM